jgi:hypothetical protein
LRVFFCWCILLTARTHGSEKSLWKKEIFLCFASPGGYTIEKHPFSGCFWVDVIREFLFSLLVFAVSFGRSVA